MVRSHKNDSEGASSTFLSALLLCTIRRLEEPPNYLILAPLRGSLGGAIGSDRQDYEEIKTGKKTYLARENPFGRGHWEMFEIPGGVLLKLEEMT